ncbi:hypothetical protein [Nitrosovibrio sp. Nv17]|uniref:hypothetical protein n=1 Tax=Nitrosovibrio sp. Nv17 TaxID=1855339 RepID=UPI00090892D6|nr:hypothetical protein [Nitrosovibrio sp. Nv17]SFW39600.1 hypothetical protein SAMN05216414_13412 [Nitrosovibrio sp. Nv17]
MTHVTTTPAPVRELVAAVASAYGSLKQAAHALEALQQLLSGARNDLDPEDLYWLIQPIQDAIMNALVEIDSGLPGRARP